MLFVNVIVFSPSNLLFVSFNEFLPSILIIESAVNQVGRDGGKVISNRVYGNSHSTPININIKLNNYGKRSIKL